MGDDASPPTQPIKFKPRATKKPEESPPPAAGAPLPEASPAEPANLPAPPADGAPRRVIDPLWDDRHEHPNNYIYTDELDRTEVFRVIPDSGCKAGYRRMPVAILKPGTTLQTLIRAVGGGQYHKMAFSNSEQKEIITWAKFELPGTAIALDAVFMNNGPVSNDSSRAPIMETQNGLAGIHGLDPMVQFAFAQQQMLVAHAREDARYMISSWVDVVGRIAAVRNGQNGVAGELLQMIQAQANRSDNEVSEVRRELRDAMQRMERLVSENQRLSIQKPGPTFEGAMAETVPKVLESIVELGGMAAKNALAPKP